MRPTRTAWLNQSHWLLGVIAHTYGGVGRCILLEAPREPFLTYSLPTPSPAVPSPPLDPPALSLPSPPHASLQVSSLMCEMFRDEPLLDFVVAEDLLAHAMQDTSLPDVLTAMLFHKGFTALTTYRLMNWLWRRDRRNMARYLQSICSEVGFVLGRRASMGVALFGLSVFWLTLLLVRGTVQYRWDIIFFFNAKR